MAFAGIYPPQQGGPSTIDLLLGLMAGGQRRPLPPAPTPGGGAAFAPDFSGARKPLPGTAYTDPNAGAITLGKLFTDRMPGAVAGGGGYNPNGPVPNVETTEAVVEPQAPVAPYGSPGTPGAGFDAGTPIPQPGITPGPMPPTYDLPTQDIPAGESAPPIGGDAAPAPAAGGMDALVKALGGLTAPPRRPPIGVATPPPPRAAPGGGGELLAALMALGGMRGGAQIPPLGALVR